MPDQSTDKPINMSHLRFRGPIVPSARTAFVATLKLDELYTLYSSRTQILASPRRSSVEALDFFDQDTFLEVHDMLGNWQDAVREALQQTSADNAKAWFRLTLDWVQQ